DAPEDALIYFASSQETVKKGDPQSPRYSPFGRLSRHAEEHEGAIIVLKSPSQ
ncbi:hypothetical protein SK128_006434, partial [Halocaridina rubra]